MSIFDSFERKHDYLVCVDSDGCVMDTMNCKHFHCFGPCMVTEWDLEEWQAAILERWNVINLFSMTRGINRFKGLAMALGEIDKQYKPITGIAALQHWAETAPALSNDAVAKAAAEATDADAKLVFEKALSWSKAVNAAIVELDEALPRKAWLQRMYLPMLLWFPLPTGMLSKKSGASLACWSIPISFWPRTWVPRLPASRKC